MLITTAKLFSIAREHEHSIVSTGTEEDEANILQAEGCDGKAKGLTKPCNDWNGQPEGHSNRDERDQYGKGGAVDETQHHQDDEHAECQPQIQAAPRPTKDTGIEVILYGRIPRESKGRACRDMLRC